MKRIFILLLLNSPLMLLAHPGHDGAHGSDGYTIIHFLTHVDHLLVSGISLAILALVWLAKSKRSKLSIEKCNQ